MSCTNTRVRARVHVMGFNTAMVSDDELNRSIELAEQRWTNARAVRLARSKTWRAGHAAERADAEKRARLRHQKCAARTRSGTACNRRALANGRCPNHGGLSSGPKTSEGRARIAAAQRRRWAAWRAAGQSTEACHKISKKTEI